MSRSTRVFAVVTAGHSPSEDDPLAEYTRGGSKALIPILGKPMISYVLEALAGSRYVEHIAVVGLDPDAQFQPTVPVAYVPDAGDILGNIEAGMQYAMAQHPDLDAILVSSSDVPTISSAIVDAFIEQCLQTDHDLYYSVVERSVMEKRFPASRRSYVHLRDGDVAGGDVILIRPSLLVSQRDLWRSLSRARKSALKQASFFGPWLLLRLLARRLSLAEAERSVSRKLHMRGRVVSSPHAELGMDVDKPFQLDIVRATLEGRVPSSAA